MPNWAEQVTAIATAVSALGLLSAIGAVIFAGRQAREARIGREAATAAEFFRRRDEAALVETRWGTGLLRATWCARKHGGFDFELIRTLLGRGLIDRWEMRQPTIGAIGARTPTRCLTGW